MPPFAVYSSQLGLRSRLPHPPRSSTPRNRLACFAATAFSRLAPLLLGAILLAASPSEARAQVDLVLNVADSPDPIPRSGVVTYSVVVENNGGTTATGVVYTMAVPGTATYDGFTVGSGAACTGMTVGQAGPGTLTCSLPNTPFNVSRSFTVRLQLNAVGNSTDVTSEVYANEADTDGGNNSVTTTTTLIAGADASLLITAPATSYPSGSLLPLTFAVANAGPDPATAVRVQFPIASGLAIQGALPAGCTNSGGTITCNVAGPITSGGSFTLGTITGRVISAAASVIGISASVGVQPGAPNGTAQDPDANNNSALLNIAVTDGSDVRVSMSRSVAPPYFTGASFNFVLTAAYDGDVPFSLTLLDTLPANYVIGAVAASQNGWSCGVAGQVVTCTRPAGVNAGLNQSLGSISIPVTVGTPGSNVVNSAHISSANPIDPDLSNNVATDGGPNLLEPVADLRITKTGPNPALVVVGVPFTWTLSSRNLGPSAFFGDVIITDSLPVGVTVNSISGSGWSCAPTPPVAGDAAVVCSRTVTSGSPLGSNGSLPDIVLEAVSTQAGSLVNVARLNTVNANVPDTALANNRTTHTVTSSTGPASADISVRKSTAPGDTPAGELLTYRLQVVNSGVDTARNITLIDTLSALINTGSGPTGQGFVGATVVTQGLASAVSCSSSPLGSGTSRILTCTIPVLPVCTVDSDCPVVDVSVRPGGNGGVRTNRARAFSTTTADPNTANNTDVVQSTVLPRADVRLTLTDTPDPVAAGQPLAYVLAAINSGPSQATDVTVLDSLPLGVLFVSATPTQGSCSITPTPNSVTAPGNRVVSCNLLTLPNGAQRTVNVVVRPTTPTRGTTLTNVGRVSTSTTEPDPPGDTNNSATSTTLVQNPVLDLLVNNFDTVDPLSLDSLTIYNVTVTNAGPSDAENVVITDSLPAAGFAFVSQTHSAGSCGTIPTVGQVGGVLECTVPRIAAGSTVALAITMRGVLKGVYTNRAKVFSDEIAFEADTANNRSTQRTTVRTRADMEVVSKVASPDPVPVRRPFSWTIRVRNNVGSGLSEADSVRVSDILPTGMELTGTPVAVIAGGAVTTNVCGGASGETAFTCFFGTVDPGTIIDITVPVRSLVVPAGGSFTNTATVTTTSLDIVPGNNSRPGTVAISSSSLAGRVFRDFNSNGAVDAGDTGIGSISMTLSGNAFDNSAVSRTVSTQPDGSFVVAAIPEGLYTVTRGAVSESFLTVGQQTAGTSAGNAATPPAISGVALAEVTAATGYLYALVPQPRIGLAKRVFGTPVANSDGSITAVLRILARNYSLEPLDNIVVSDQLSGAAPLFGNYVAGGAAATLAAGSYTIDAAPSLVGACVGGTPNSSFTGNGDNALGSITSLSPSTSCELQFSLRYQPTDPLPAGNYTNQAAGTGVGALSGRTENDLSNNGANPDPDNDGLPGNNNVPTPLGAVLAADVTTAVAFPTTVNAGNVVNGTVRFSNLGPYTAETVTYTLTLSTNLTGVGFGNLPTGATATYAATTGVVTFTGMPTTLAPAAIASGNGTSPITVTYVQNGVANSTITSTIATTSNEGANTGPNSATATVLGDLIVDVTTTVAFPATADAGVPVTGTVVFTNNGPSTAAGVTYTLTLSTNLTGVSFGNLPAGAAAVYAPTTGVVTFTNMPISLAMGAIASGNGTAGITVNYTQPGTATSSVTSTIGTSTSQGANVAPDSATTSLSGQLIADVTTSMVFPVMADAGTAVNGTVRFENTGPSIASGMTYSMTLTPNVSGVTFGNLPGGVVATYTPGTGLVTFTGMPTTLAVGALASGNGTSGITLAYTQPGVALSNITSTIGTSTNQGANIALDNAAASPGGGLIADVRTVVQAPAAVDAGEVVNATVTYSNLGPSIATITGYVLTMNPGLTNVTFGNLPVGATATYAPTTGTVTLTGMPATLAAAAIASGNGTTGITVRYTQNAVANSTVTGTIFTSTNQGANIAPDSDTRTILGARIADVTTVISGFPASAIPGETASGRLLFRNAGPSASDGTSYTLQLSAALTGVTIGNLPAGATAIYAPGTGVVTFTGMPITVAPGTIVSGDGVNGLLLSFLQISPKVEISSTIGTITSQGANVLPDNARAEVAGLLPLDLLIEKTASVAMASMGDTIRYLVRVTNLGPTNATGASYLRDDAVAGVSLLAVRCTTLAGNVCVSPPTASSIQSGFLLPPLAAQQQYEVEIDALVTAAMGGVITNRAVVLAPPGFVDTNPDNNEAQAGPFPVEPAVDLAISKRLLTSLEPGREARYELTVRNVGTVVTSDSIVVTDALVNDLQFVSATGTGWSCGAAGQLVSCTRGGTLAVNDASSIVLTVAVSASATNAIRNVAIVGLPGDRRPVNDTSEVTGTLVRNPDLALTKRALVDTLERGALAEYLLSVRNLGVGATSGPITVTDTLPGGLTAESASGDGFVCSIAGQGVSCVRTQPLAPAEAVDIRIAVRVGEAITSLSLTNRACVETPSDVDVGNNCDTTSTPLSARRAAELLKRESRPFDANGVGAFSLVIYNRGDGELVGPLRVTDTLPSTLSFVSAGGAEWSCNNSAGVVDCLRNSAIARGDSAVVIVQAQLAPGTTTVTNCATLSAPTGTQLAGGGRSCVTVLRAPGVDLELHKRALADTVRAGGSAAWNLVVRNRGVIATSAPVMLTDTLPMSVQPLTATGADFACTVLGQLVQCERTTPLAPGDSATVRIAARVLDGVMDRVRNTACATTSGDANPTNDCSSSDTPVGGRREGGLRKDAVGEFVVGQTGTFRLWVRNVGSVPLAGPLTVTDSLPNGLDFVSAIGAGWSCSARGTVVSCERDAALAPGDSSAITLVTNVQAAAMPAVTNCAHLTVPSGSSVANDGRSCATARPTADYRLVLELSTPRYLRQLQDAPDFTVIVRNIGRSPLPDVVVTNLLPNGFTYVTGSSTRGGQPDAQSRARINDPTSASPTSIAWPVGTMQPGQAIRLDYRALIRAGASFNQDNITVSSAVSTVPGLVVTSNTATVPIKLERGLFDTRGMIAGKVYAQCDCVGEIGQDEGDVGIPGVRVLLENGTSAITDAEGKFNILDVRAGLHVVKVDATTLPAGVTLQLLNTRNAGDAASRFVDLKAGEMHRADFAAVVPTSEVLAEILARRRLGETSAALVAAANAGRVNAGGMPPGDTPLTTYVPLVPARALHDGNSNLPAPPERAAAQLTGMPSDSARVVPDSTVYVPEGRPLIATGLLQGRVELRSLSRGGLSLSAADDRFEDLLQDVAITGDSGRVRAAARGALLLKGTVKGAGLLTLAFDSERDAERTQFRDISPETGFSLFGDASLREFDAQSQQRLYARLDRGASFVRYGDFTTTRTDERRLLLAYDRALTGFTAHTEGARGVLNAFASRNGIRQVVDELPGRGLSGPYYLARTDAVVNSERVEIITRDRNQPSLILRSEPMIRFEEYVIEPFSGRLLFRAPVPSLDAQLNPVSIRVSYETEQVGDQFMTVGGDGVWRVAEQLELGGFAVRDENPLQQQSMFGGSASAQLGVGTTLLAELARTESSSSGLSGNAWRVELRHQSARLEGRLFAVQGDSTFGNQSSTFVGGRNEYGARWSARLGEGTRLLAEAMRTEDTRTSGRRDGALLAIEQRLSDRFLSEFGVRWADENGASVSPFFGMGGLTTGTTTPVANGLSPVSFSAARARVSARLPGAERSTLFAEYEHGLNAPGARRGALGGEYVLLEKARLYLRHEWVSSPEGAFALAQERNQQNTVFGIDADYLRNGQVFSEYRARDAFSGRDAEASMGLRNRWTLADGIRANTSFERVTPLLGTTNTEAYAATAAVEFTQSPLWKGTARLEWRTSPAGDNLLGSVGYARKLSRDWSMLGRSLWDQISSTQLRGRSQLGFAWRQTDRNRVNALFRVENLIDGTDAMGEPVARSMANVAVALLNVQPSTDFTMSMRYAGKRALDRRDEVDTRSSAHLVMLRSIYDISSRLDVGAITTVLGNGSFAERRYGVGGEVGVVAARNLRLALGYNLFGFTDRDFESLGYTQRGPYIEFGFKFDESLFGAGRSAR